MRVRQQKQNRYVQLEILLLFKRKQEKNKGKLGIVINKHPIIVAGGGVKLIPVPPENKNTSIINIDKGLPVSQGDETPNLKVTRDTECSTQKKIPSQCSPQWHIAFPCHPTNYLNKIYQKTDSH